MHFNDLLPTRDDARVAIDALRVLHDCADIFGARLIPTSYAKFHQQLMHSLMTRDMVKGEFAGTPSHVLSDVLVDSSDQYAVLEAHRKALRAGSAS